MSDSTRSSSRATSLRNLRAYHEEALETGIGDGHLLSLLWPFLRPHRTWLIVAVTTVLVTSALSLARPLVMLWTIDQSIATRDPSIILRGGMLFAALSVLEQGFSFLQIYATQVMGARAMADLRLFVFRFLSRLPQIFFDRHPVGRLVTRVTNDVDAIQELFSSGAVSALGDIVRLLGVVVLMVSLDLRLSSVAFFSLPFIALLLFWVRGRAREAFRTIRAETARMNSNMNEQVAGVALVQAYGQQGQMLTQFDQINQSYRDANLRSVKYEAIQDAAIDAVSGISLASIIVALGYHHASFGVVVALSAYLSQFFEPISMLAQRYTLLQSALSGAERVFNLLQEKERDAPLVAGQLESPAAVLLDAEAAAVGLPTAGPATGARAAPAVDGAIALEFERVSFGYKPDVPVLREVSFRARRGQVVALVGPTGSGKTTITALLLRLYELSSGMVSVDGHDIRTIPARELRSRFAVVPQDVVLFPGTLAENIALGVDVDAQRVTQVLTDMGVLDLFLARRHGLSARVESGGGNFSAGERQLIAFARALYKDAPFLILDEATASVDSETEARMGRALQVVMQGRTSIVVAHRLSTVRAADRIIVLSRGRVREEGTHEELLTLGGLYAALHQLQFSRVEDQHSSQVEDQHFSQ